MGDQEHEHQTALVRQEPPDALGATWADVYLRSEVRPKLEAALARVLNWTVGGLTRVEEAGQRILDLLGRLNQNLEDRNAHPEPIPERVVLEIAENVAREERDELRDLWAELLTSAALGMDVDAFHIDIVRRLNSPAAKVLVIVATGGASAWGINTHDPALARCLALGLVERPQRQYNLLSSTEAMRKWGSDGPMLMEDDSAPYQLTATGQALFVRLGLSRATPGAPEQSKGP